MTGTGKQEERKHEMTTATIIFTNTEADGVTYEVTEVFNPNWELPSSLYFVNRNQGDHDPRFFNIYVGENKARAMSIAGAC